MKYYKHTETGEVFLYEQSDIETVGLITDLESQLDVLQQWLIDTPEPPILEVEDDGAVVEDKYSEARAEYKQKQDEAEAIQSQLDNILPVFFDIRDKLKLLTELTGSELEEHLNPVPTNEQLAATVRAERDRLIESVRWRIERHNDELALGREPTEPLEPLLQYVQALRDVPQQEGFPETISWPVLSEQRAAHEYRKNGCCSAIRKKL